MKRSKSNMLNDKIGLPQGSILGPLLYLIYVNSIPNALNCISRLYANDTCLIIHECKANTLQKKINTNIRNLNVWFDATQRTLNLSRLPVQLFLHLIQI